ncbi:uncharacterized protein LOC134249564 [Saccostrea cucullata]|uniref:uncharacterized protein LOC134249564 n=1 Tax=Saccostrea cuccullata TaxID=36930 RepID=UPI002ED3D92B
METKKTVWLRAFFLKMLVTCSRCDQWPSPTDIKKSESDTLQTVLSLLQQHIIDQDVKMKNLAEELSAVKKMLSQCDVTTSSSKTIEPMDTLNSTKPEKGGDMTVPSSTSTSSTTTVTPSTTKAPRIIGSRGSEFLILFMMNHPFAHGNLTIYLTSIDETTVKILTSPHLNTNIKLVNNFTSSFTLTLPRDIVCEYLTVEPKGLILQTSELSTVTIFDRFYTSSNDGTLIIPTQKLSNKYIISSTDPNRYSQFAIGALYNRTTVEITFKFKANTPLTIQGKSYSDGDNFTVILERFETLQIAHTTEPL